MGDSRPDTVGTGDPSPSYSTLLRRTREFRLLWAGQVVSQLGDWFNSVAIYTMLLAMTGSATAVAVMVVVQQLPAAFVGPYAGVIVDRFDRRRVMIAADLFRGVVVLGLLAVRDAQHVWIAYPVVGLAVLATAFFEPARSALLPAVVRPADLVLANSLSAATWATMLAVGAAAGGVVTAWLGHEVAFVLNAASFFASAVCIWAMRTPARPLPVGGHLTVPAAGFRDGIRFMRRTPRVAAYLSIKAAWAMAGGALLLLTVFGDRVFRLGSDAALGIGVLYTARGVGAGAGALAVQRVLGSERHRLERGIAPAYLAAGLCYAGLAVVPELWGAALLVVAAHAAGSLLWVSSSVLLQLTVPDAYRGRVFAMDLALLTAVASLASYTTGLGLDRVGIPPRTMAVIIGGLFLAPAMVWFLRRRSSAPLERV